MSAIFISHSSADNEAAAKMKAWLEEQGYTSVSLDFDPEDGVPRGVNWEQQVYRMLRHSQAVIVLLTPHWLASRWCFAEMVQARAQGKAIFPVKVQQCETPDVIKDVQLIDLIDDPDEGHRRLAHSLNQGLDPRSILPWSFTRPLYPGLATFEEADAAIFFGRDKEIAEGLETLTMLRHLSGEAPHFALFLGPSGSGKSSLVRAGLIPRLKQTPSAWLPLPPFRPEVDPLDGLARALAHQFEDLGKPRDSREIRQTLKTAAEQKPADGGVLLALAHELCEITEQCAATVILTIDQAEELFSYSTPKAATQFLGMLRAALETSHVCHLMAIATLRSDFLDEFLLNPALHDPTYDHDFAYKTITVAPVAEQNFAEIIAGPAKLGGLELADGLIPAMVRDAGTRDALPLLAFTLRQLWDKHAQDGRLALRDYEEGGRLEGTICAAAEAVLEDAAPSLDELNALQAAFVPPLVRINADGVYERRRIYADEIPPRAKMLLSRFVDARLLISDRAEDGRETLAVSHEALFRSWPRLAAWLNEDQELLRMLEGLHRAAADWDSSGQRDDFLIHRDGRLQDIEELISIGRFSIKENSPQKRYLEACVKVRHASEAADRKKQEREHPRSKQKAKPTKIFICYRRDDSIDAAGRLYDRLQAYFGKDRVFIDVDAIPLGVDFQVHIDTVLNECGVLLALIGDHWLKATFPDGLKKGEKRLDDPADFVRIEIETALAQGIRVIPILFGRASMPSEEVLPAGLRKLAFLNAAEVRPGRDFHTHVDLLIESLCEQLGLIKKKRSSSFIRTILNGLFPRRP